MFHFPLRHFNMIFLQKIQFKPGSYFEIEMFENFIKKHSNRQGGSDGLMGMDVKGELECRY